MTKFVLLGHMRSGSTLVLHALSRHPNVHIYGELFNRSRKVREHDFASGITNCSVAQTNGIDGNSYFKEGEDGAEFLANRVFFHRPAKPLAVGFKLFYEHARDTAASSRAWEYLAAHKDVRIIHLTRRNLVKTLVSLRLATKTRVWSMPKGKEASEVGPASLCMDPEEFEEFFQEQSETQRQAMELFKEHQIMTIEYQDDVCDRFQETLHRIHEFLEIPRRRAAMLIEKQGRGRLRDRLSNYRELRTHFAGTPYETMFD